MTALRAITISVLFAGQFVVFTSPAAAGNLVPPGAPAPTFKTLDEVQPGVPLSQDDIPYAIGANGVYYLTEDLVVPTGEVAIFVSNRVRHVTIDLGGFSIYGDPGDSADSIAIDADSTPDAATLLVRNGVIRDINGPAIQAPNWSLHVEDIVIRDVQQFGIRGGDDSSVRRCTITGVSNSATVASASAIRLGANSTVRDSRVTGMVSSLNGGELRGIQVGEGSVIEGNAVDSLRGGDSASDITAIAIDANLGARVENNTVTRIGHQENGGIPPTVAIAAGISASASAIVGNMIEELASTGEIYGIVGVASSIRDNNIRSLVKVGNEEDGYGIFGIGESRIVGNKLANIRTAPGGTQTFAGIYINGRALVKRNHVSGLFVDQQQTNRIAGILIDQRQSFVRRNTILSSPLGGGPAGNAVVLGNSAMENIVLGNQYIGFWVDLNFGANLTDDPAEPNLTY